MQLELQVNMWGNDFGDAEMRVPLVAPRRRCPSRDSGTESEV